MDILYTLAQEGGQAPPGGAFGMFAPLILIFAVVYFLMLRPQIKKQKERQAMLDSVKTGTDVVTVGGLHGKIVGFKNGDKVVTLKIADNIKVDVDRTAISLVRSSGESEDKK